MKLDFKFQIILLSILLWAICSHRTVYKVLIDSGSTGSRVYVYRYLRENPIVTLREVAHMRVRPALSSFYQNREGLEEQMGSLIEFAEQHVAPRYQGITAIALKATAGLRVMPLVEQEWIIEQIRDILSATNFSFNPVETRVISGGEEALFALLATNFAFSNVSHDFELKLGAADLGGSSKQIAFALPPRTVTFSTLTQLSWTSLWSIFFSYPQDCQADYKLSLPGTNKYIEIFARSIAGLGIVAAMQEVFEKMASKWEYAMHSGGGGGGWCPLLDYPSDSSASSCVHSTSPLIRQYYSDNVDFEHNSYGSGTFGRYRILSNPCTSPGVSFPYDPYLSHYPWTGTGDFDSCAQWIKEMVEAKASSEIGCMKQLRPSNPTSIIAMDNFPKVLEVMGLTAEDLISPAMIREMGREICQISWTEILARHPDYPPYRAQNVCFGSAFIYVIVTELYQVPEQDRLSFVPTDEHHHFSVGWPLGAALYHATNLTFDTNLQGGIYS